MDISDEEREIIIEHILEIDRRIREITAYFDIKDQDILKHLAASAIHISLFMKDFYIALVEDAPVNNAELIDRFLEECGCDFNKNNSHLADNKE